MTNGQYYTLCILILLSPVINKPERYFMIVAYIIYSLIEVMGWAK